MSEAFMDQFMVYAGVALFSLMLMLLYRFTVGPTVIDRLLSINLIGTKTMILLVIIGMVFHRVDMFVDLALTYALLNFIGSLAAAKFFRRRRSIHHDQQDRDLDHAPQGTPEESPL